MTRRFRPFDPFERGGPLQGAREIRIPRPPRRFWFGVGLFGIAFLIFFLASPTVWLITELQWYDALGFKDVFTTRLTLQTALFAGSFALAFIYLAVNVVIALRIRSGPGLRAVGIKRPSIRNAAGVIDPDVCGVDGRSFDLQDHKVSQDRPLATAMPGNDCGVDERRAVVDGNALPHPKTVNEVLMHVTGDARDDEPPGRPQSLEGLFLIGIAPICRR